MLTYRSRTDAINVLASFVIAISIVSETLLHVGLVGILIILAFSKNQRKANKLEIFAFLLIVQWCLIKLLRKTIVDWEMNGSFLEDTLRWLLMSACILWFAKKQMLFSFKIIAIGSTTALYLAGIVASYQHFALGIERAGGDENPINFGIFISIYTVITTIFLIKNFSSLSLKFKLFIAFAYPLGIWGILLSGSRGPMLTYCITCALLSTFYFRHKLHNKHTALTIIFSILATTSAFTLFAWKTEIISSSVVQFEVWQETRAMTRIGARFEFWISSIDTFLQYPIFGAADELRILQREGGKYLKFNPDAAKWAHAHNEMLEALGKYGLIGFISIWLVWLAPSILKKHSINPLNSLGLETLQFMYLAWFLGGLTQVLTHHTSGLTLLPFFAAIMLNLKADSSSNESSKSPTPEQH